MSSPKPQPVVPKSGGYARESNTFSSFNDLFRFFATKSMRPSLTSPPLAHQVGELEAVLDKTLLRIYYKVDGVLRYVQLT